ncbi:protein Shroom2 [Paramisgurnus dabryanus]|uniref:protein Shroom2 n=1 Tax=Paramisgurnus dabryanus TaxID=90735 RepID=UPI0031F39858
MEIKSAVDSGVLSEEDHEDEDDVIVFVELMLSGGSPWGFTVRGGLEYHEPLIITKVEDGSRAALGRLQIGDEIVSVNSVLLSGYRQEAIGLVKRSYKNLYLGIKRRNESSCRPQSWHSKSTDNLNTDIPKSEADPAAESSWQTKYDAGSHSKDYTSCWGQANLRQVSCQFSSVGNMESVEPLPHAFSKESQSDKPKAGADNPVVERGLGKPTSAYSALLSGKTDHGAPRGMTSTESMFYRGSPNELGVTNDCHKYLQIPMSTGGRVSPSMEEHTGFKFSPTGRSNLGPVWHVPEKKLSTAQDPLAPPPPLRSDSFTATRVHEKSLVGTFPEGRSVYSQQKPHCRSVDQQFENIHTNERGCEARHTYNPPPKKDFLHPYLSVEDYNPKQLNPNKLLSLSSTDVRQGQNPFTYEVLHQRQHSDESPFSMYPSTACTSKTQSVGNYYLSLQHLPTNSGNQNQSRTSTAFDHNHEGQAHFRYYCITAQQPSLESSTITQVWKGDERRTEAGSTQSVTDKSVVGSQKVIKTKCPQHYLTLHENKLHGTATCPGPKYVISKSRSGERERDKEKKSKNGIGTQELFMHEPNHQTEQKKNISTHHQDSPWISKQEEKICPHKTPLLYSLTQESKKMAEKSLVTAKGGVRQESDSIGGKLERRSDRYATTLRNEIQQKKAQLQKSRSAANLICSNEIEEDSVVWKSNETSTSSSDGSFTNTYKDHLKEAQAKVLKATSFMRKDLEFFGNETLTGQPPKNFGCVHGQLTRIGGRKRFSMDKKMRSFSEPEKINEVGVEDKAVGSFADRYKFFEGSCKPNFQKPILKQSLLSPREDHNERKTTLTRDNEKISKASFKQSKSNDSYLNIQEQQRLGTFAEYEATWNMLKNPLERRTTGRYHSAENILDSGMEESSGTMCVHERSRSSPCADIHAEKISLPPTLTPLESPSVHKDQKESYVSREQGPFSISEPVTLSTLKNEAVDTLHSSNQRLRPDSRELTRLSSHHLQVPVSKQKVPKNKGPEPQTSRPDTPTQLEIPCPSRTTQAAQPIAQGISAVRFRPASPEPTQTPHSFCSSLYRTEPLEREMCLTTVPEDGQKSESREAVLGHSSMSPQQNLDLSKSPSNRKCSPSPLLFLESLPDEPPVQKTDSHSCKLKETSEKSTAEQIVPIQIFCSENDSEKESRNYLQHGESSGGHEVSTTSRMKNSKTEQSSSEQQTNDETESLDTEPNRTSDPAEHSAEDLKREELARDIMGKDKSLADILDQSKMKTTMDLMEGIFPHGEQLLEGAQQRKKSTVKQTATKNTLQRVEESLASSVTLLSSSSYYSTSAPKAELLIKMKDMQEHLNQQDLDDDLDLDLSNKKQELMVSLSRKLQVLREARASLQEDIQDNNVLGEEVETTVRSVCRPNELEKFCMFVGDLDKVVSLLLSLSGRLARVENALDYLDDGTSADEKQTLMEKRKLLIRQHEDAKELKENLDRRERLVYDILTGYLSEEHLADYQYFVKMKSALIIEQRKLEDKIKLGEEQLKCLKDSLPLDQRLLY